jgi:uncharacterized membrane protein YuzA (DUF378 family)
MKNLDILTRVLLIVGGLNWGLVAIAEFDLVATVVGLEFGQTNAWSRIIYGLVGLSAVYQAARLPAATRQPLADRSHAMSA